MPFFFAIQARKMSFTIFQNKKTSFQPIKTTRSKSRKIEIFPKGLTHGFGQIKSHFSMSSFQTIQTTKIFFYNILERNNVFLAYKEKKFKKSKNGDFSEGVNPWFLSKNGHFSMVFFLCNIGQENVFYNVLEQKKSLSTL